MKFKALEVTGFKSFMDRKEIKFGGGITAIVGPNGCGKSNVADAIRWVLGEQSARLLRGDSMQDVIFSGTEKRKPLSFCEVNLFFDNTASESGAKLFPTLDYKEVVISRRLFRSGESEYLLNKQQCRLRDISELLREGNTGKEGYSIIGQGRIDQLLSAKPEDRRSIFEEAAGIARHKQKKTEAERRLSRTTENLIRVADIVDLKAAHLNPLIKQSQNAMKYKQMADQLKYHEVNLYITAFESASSQKGSINQRLNKVKLEIANKNQESERAAVSYNDAIAAISSADKNIESLREELLSLSTTLAEDAAQIKVLSERLVFLNNQTTSLREESEKNLSQKKEYLLELQKNRKLILEKRVELGKVKFTFERAEKEYQQVAERLQKLEGDAASKRSEFISAMEKLADIKQNMGRLLAEKASLKEKVEDLSDREKFSKDKLSGDKSLKTELENAVRELSKQREEQVKKRDTQSNINNESMSIIGSSSIELESLNSTYHKETTRLKMFLEAQESSDALGESVQKLLKDAKLSAELSSKIEGVVASIVKVEKHLEVAIEVALGAGLQNIVTKSEEEARFLISYLKEKRYGRVTFSPLSSVKRRSISPQYQDLLKDEGVVCVGTDAVKFDKKFEPVISSLLGGTVFVKTIDDGIRLAKKSGYAFRIVSLDGEVLQTSGNISGGSKKSELKNIFGFDREIKELLASTQKHAADIKRLTEKKEQATKMQKEALEAISCASQKLYDIDILLATKNKALQSVSEGYADTETLLKHLGSEIAESKQRIGKIDSDINSVSHLEEMAALKGNTATASEKEEKERLDRVRLERDTVFQKKSSVAIEVTSLEGEITLLTDRNLSLEKTTQILTHNIDYAANQIKENEEVAASITKKLDRAEAIKGQSDDKRVLALREKITGHDETKAKMQQTLVDLEKRRGELLEEIQKLHDKKSVEDQLLLKVDTDIEQMQQRIAEEYELTYGACLPLRDSEYEVEAGAIEAEKLRRQIKNIGPVSLDTIEQAKAAYEDYHQLNQQKEDLLAAKRDLEKIIADLASEMQQIFSTEFEKIRENFMVIFRELFNGGRADLILQESENPLEAGIEIVAQPPDKKLQTISLLSGGERALTAIAILFSILRLRPMPFCVLDEIEAALDEANVGRFAQYLKRFSEVTQFIVITHRKPTMELADALFGVTMEEKGVSKIVSVKLSEVS